MSRRRGSSGRWLEERRRDPFVAAAERDGYRSRASYKLVEIDERTGVLAAAQAVVDLGAAPGGWSQVVRRRRPAATIVAADLLAMAPIEGVEFVQGDCTEPAVQARIRGLLPEGGADLVICDMAPNLSGIRAVDQARSEALVDMALDFTEAVLQPGGHFVVKVFQGTGFDQWLRTARDRFESARIVKPRASRDRSRETYLVCRGRRA